MQRLHLPSAQSGMSLVEVLVGVALSIVISVAALKAVTLAKGAETQIKNKYDLATEHANLIGTLSSPALVRKMLGLDVASADNISKCLTGLGTNCQSLAKEPQDFAGAVSGSNKKFAQNILGACFFEPNQCKTARTSAAIHWICPSDNECTTAKISAQTRLVASVVEGAGSISKTSNIELPSRFLLSRGQLNFACANGNTSGLVTSLDYVSLTATCGGIQTRDADPGYAARLYTTDSPTLLPTPVSCSIGISTLNMFGGSDQSQCAVIPPPVVLGDPSTPPDPPTTPPQQTVCPGGGGTVGADYGWCKMGHDPGQSTVTLKLETSIGGCLAAAQQFGADGFEINRTHCQLLKGHVECYGTPGYLAPNSKNTETMLFHCHP